MSSGRSTRRPTRTPASPAVDKVIALLAFACSRAHRATPSTEYAQTGRLDSIASPVRHAHHRADPDRDRDQHRPRPDGRGRPQDPDLPRLDRDDPRRRPRRADRRSGHRRPVQPALDVRPAAAVPLRLRGAVRHRRGRDRPLRRASSAALGLLPEPAEHAAGPARARGGRRPRGDRRVSAIYGFIPFYTQRAVTFFEPARTTGRTRSSSILGWLVALLLIGVAHRAARAAVRPSRSGGGVRRRRRACSAGSCPRSSPRRSRPIVFGGVTGSGTDFLVAAFQQAGSDLQTAVLKQGLLSDPIDKTLDVLRRLRDPAALSAPVRRAVPAGRAGGRPGGRA